MTPFLLSHDHQFAQPCVFFIKHEWSGSIHALGISLQNGRADVISIDVLRTSRQQRTCRQSHQVEHIGHLSRLVEVVHAPHEAAVIIPPGAEVFQVDVANRKNRWRRCEVRWNRQGEA